MMPLGFKAAVLGFFPKEARAPQGRGVDVEGLGVDVHKDRGGPQQRMTSAVAMKVKGGGEDGRPPGPT